MRHETHAHEDDVVVFNIGMTIQRKHRIDLWWPAFIAMPAMIAAQTFVSAVATTFSFWLKKPARLAAP